MRRTLIGILALTLVLAGCGGTSGEPSAQAPDNTNAESPAAKPPAASEGNAPAVTPETPAAAPGTPDATPAPSTSAPAPSQKPSRDRLLPPKPPAATEPPLVTEADFEKVDFDMTYEEVAKVMGQLGKEVHTEGNYDDRTLVEVYEYKHEKGTFRITFRNGRMNNKSATYS